MITLELTCVCGEALSYEGDRAGERLASAEHTKVFCTAWS